MGEEVYCEPISPEGVMLSGLFNSWRKINRGGFLV